MLRDFKFEAAGTLEGDYKLKFSKLKWVFLAALFFVVHQPFCHQQKTIGSITATVVVQTFNKRAPNCLQYCPYPYL